MTARNVDLTEPVTYAVQIPGPRGALHGDLVLPLHTGAVVLFAHGSGSSRHSPRNRLVAQTLQQAGLGTLLMDLLTEHEEMSERAGGMLRFDVNLLADALALPPSGWMQRPRRAS